jgi:hypothetical protein
MLGATTAISRIILSHSTTLAASTPPRETSDGEHIDFGGHTEESAHRAHHWVVECLFGWVLVPITNVA